MATDRSRLWLLPQIAVAAVFVAAGLALMLVPRDAVAAFVGGHEDDFISTVRFIGSLTIVSGVALLAPVFLRPGRTAGRAVVAEAAAAGSLLLALVLIGRGQLYAGCVLAAASYVVAGMAVCFAIWGPEEIKLRASLPDRWQRRLRIGGGS